MIEIISPLIKQFLPFAQKHMGFDAPPKLFLRGDDKNAQNPLGKTAYYDPSAKSITVYITGRHPKDVMRSISHELVHHAQCCRGDFEGQHDTGPGYAQNDEHMREMEREAYEKGNMCFRDWEDSIKNTIYLEHLQKGENKMSTKDWKNKEVTTLLSEAWGFKFNSLQEFEEFNGSGEVQTEGEEEVEEGHQPRLSSHSGENSPTQATRSTRDVSGAVPPAKDEDEEDELEEVTKTNRPDRVVGRDTAGRRLDEEEDEIEEVKIAKKGKHDDGDGKDEKCDHVPCEDEQSKKDRKPTKEQIEKLVKKALQEALQKRKG